MGEYITSRPAIYSSRSAFVTAEQTEQKEEGGTDVDEDGNRVWDAGEGRVGG